MKYNEMLRRFVRGELLDVTKYSKRQRVSLATRLTRDAKRLGANIENVGTHKRFKGRGMYEEYDSPDNEGYRSVRKVPESATSDAYNRDSREMKAEMKFARRMQLKNEALKERIEAIKMDLKDPDMRRVFYNSVPKVTQAFETMNHMQESIEMNKYFEGQAHKNYELIGSVGMTEAFPTFNQFGINTDQNMPQDDIFGADETL
ncbi:hypothetical protein N8343_08335 [Akkermansiaceae bacterium]|nr:hypothetical protein [Akkermansiaceae bacterium]